MSSVDGVRRVVGVLALGIRRIGGRLAGGESTRVVLGVVGVAVAVTLMTSVTGVALGLASQSAIQSESVDYWVVPEGSSVTSIAVSTQGPDLGATHRVTTRLATDPRISYVTPVLVQVVPLTHRSTGTEEYVVLVGVIPPESGSRTIAGLSTRSLAPGDPYYANGTYDGRWTGEVVLSGAAAQLLNASSGDAVAPGGNAPGAFTVTEVSEITAVTGAGTAPVALVHLGELQAVTGATTGDAADQLLVSTDSPAVASRIERVYPQATVVKRTGFSARSVSTSSLPLAMGAAAFLISLIVGVLFVATMMGLEVVADRGTIAVLAAVGFSARSRSILIAAETVALAGIGGIIGVAGGGATIAAVNALGARYVGVQGIALFHPALVGYGIGVALLIGVLAAPYPIVLSRRADHREAITA